MRQFKRQITCKSNRYNTERKIYTERHKLQLVAVTAQNRPTAQKYIVFLT